MVAKISLPDPPGFSPENFLDSGSTLLDHQGNPLPLEQQLDNGDYLRSANDDLEAIKNNNPRKRLSNAEAAQIYNLKYLDKSTMPTPSFASRNPQSTSRDRAADTANTAEQGAAGAQKAASAASKFGSGNYVGAATDALGAINSFKNSAKGKKGDKNQKSFTSGLKKATPIIGILLLVTLPLIALGSLFLMPIHLVENIGDVFGSLSSSNSTASKASYQAMLDAASTTEYTGISKEGCEELSRQELTYSECEGAEEDPDIQAYYRSKALEDPIVASTTLAATSTTGNVFKYTDRDGVSHIVDSANFDTWWADSGFYEAITRGSLAWTGTFSGWFDDMVAELLSTYNLSRNSFQSYYEDIVDQEASADTYYEIINDANDTDTMLHDDRERLRPRNDGSNCSTWQTNDKNRTIQIRNNITAGFATNKNLEIKNRCYITVGNANLEDWEWFIDANYNDDYIEEDRNAADTLIGYYVAQDILWNTQTSTKVGTALSEAEEKVRAYLPEFTRAFSAESNTSDLCSQLFGISYFSSIVAANRLQQTADFATKALESIDKTRAGKGSESPIHQLSKQLSGTGTYEHLDQNNKPRPSSTNKAALNSQSLSWISTNSSIDPNDPSIVKLSLEGVLRGFYLSTADFTTCTFVKMGGNFLYSAISFLFGGQDGFLGEAHNSPPITSNYIDEAITRAAYGLIYNPCTTNTEGNLAMNEDVGNCLALGSHYYLSKNHQVGGGSPGDDAKVREFFREQSATVARRAEYERGSRSPFDTSSQYTFLGSIVHTITPYAASLTSSNIFSSIGSLLSTSINSLLPAASAVTEEVISTNIGNCRSLGSGEYAGKAGISAVGDTFCVPYMITDLSPSSGINQKSPIEIERTIENDFGDFSGRDDDGNPIIDIDSQFARYIKYCSQRLSTFGIIDAQIVADYTQEATNNNWFTMILRSLATSLIDGAIYMADQEDILGWSTGQYCVATNDANINPKWAQNQYYQYYMLYQRINQNRGGVAGNNALSVLKEYRQANPLETPEDLSAAMSGIPTEDYAALRSYIVYRAIDKSPFGPTLATSTSTADAFSFRRSITPLTDFLIEKVLPTTTPITGDQRQQGTTA